MSQINVLWNYKGVITNSLLNLKVKVFKLKLAGVLLFIANEDLAIIPETQSGQLYFFLNILIQPNMLRFLKIPWTFSDHNTDVPTSSDSQLSFKFLYFKAQYEALVINTKKFMLAMPSNLNNVR